MENWFKKIITTQEIFLLVSTLIVGFFTHAFNLFNYPYYENDEGTYMSQAWSLLTQGRLSPYTYTYDHAPAGWILIALWSLLSGGFSAFGFSINSGRVLMLILHMFSSLFVYLISKKYTNNSLFSSLAVIIYSFSPLAIYFHRRVLLDNIMIFWLLFSLTFYLYSNKQIKSTLFSGLLFGLALTSKENAIFFVLPFLYLIYASGTQDKARSIFSWLVSASFPVFVYFSYALTKGEFFPYGSAFGGDYPHVSLISTWVEQLNRHGGSIFDPNSSFWLSSQGWIAADPIMLALGAVAFLINLVLSIRSLPHRIISLFILSFTFFLIRGGVIFEFYVLPLLPFLAIGITLAFYRLAHNKTEIAIFLTLFMFMAFDLVYFGNRSKPSFNLFTSNQTQGQIEAVAWILSQDNPDSFYVIDNYAYIDLNTQHEAAYSNAEYYWKVDMDTQISQNILNNNWRNIDFIALTPQMRQDFDSGLLPLTKTAYENSRSVNRFFSDGWGVDIRQVNK